MMGKFLLFFMLIFGVCEALQHTTQNAKLAESQKDSSDFVESNKNNPCEVVPTSHNDGDGVDYHDLTLSNIAMTSDGINSSDSVESGNDDKMTISRNAESPNDENKSDSSDKVFDYEFPRYNDESFLNSLITRFSLYNETYFMPVYYQTHIVKSPYNKPYKKLETKLQISAKMNIFRDLFWGIGAFFGYTQTSFFQIYSQHISSPFRSNDYSPEFMLYKPLNVEFWGGSLYNIRFGYRHKSNGEVNIENGGNADFSRGIDTIALDIAYRISDFRLILKLWAYAKKSPKDIDKYLGYSDLILEYDFLSRNHLRLTIGNLAHNYAKYKGSVKLEYSFDIHNFALYLQYFYGYGDNLIEYNIKKHGVGIGFSVIRF